MYAGGGGGGRSRAFEKHRASERALEEAKSSISDTRNAILVAEWENRTYGAIRARNLSQKVDQDSKAAQESLMERRGRLKALYDREAAAWKEEVRSRMETPEQVKERMLARALELKAIRDEERRGFVEAMYAKQWRDACDEARELDSKATLAWIVEQRKQQQLEQEAMKAKGAAVFDDEEYMAKVEERVRELAAAEEERERQRMESEKHHKEFLSAQIRYNHERLMDRLRREREADEAELAELKRQMEEDLAEQRERREVAHARGRQVRDTNASRLHLRGEAAAREKEEDLRLLEYAMKKDEAGLAEEAVKREAEKEAMRNYRQFLQEQMIKEAEDQSALDDIRLQAENRIWEARDAELAAREEARRRLEEEVHKGRQEQLQLKALKEAEDKMYHDEQLELDAIAQAEADARDREEAVRRVLERREQADMLQEQVTERARIRMLEKQDEYLQMKRLEAYEREHSKRLSEQAGKVVLNHSLRSHQY